MFHVQNRVMNYFAILRSFKKGKLQISKAFVTTTQFSTKQIKFEIRSLFISCYCLNIVPFTQNAVRTQCFKPELYSRYIHMSYLKKKKRLTGSFTYLNILTLANVSLMKTHIYMHAVIDARTFFVDVELQKFWCFQPF